jgi:glycosyltransferase involved in cell wall biosynthesis
MKAPAGILLFHLGQSTFVSADKAHLAKLGPVWDFHFDTNGGFFSVAVSFFKQIFFLIKHLGIARFAVIWFADHHAFLPALCCRLLKKKVYIILGGFECNYFPEFNYGLKTSRWRSFLGVSAMKNATRLLPVSSSLLNWQADFGKPAVKMQGLHNSFPMVKTEVTILPTGYNPERFIFSDAPRPLSVVSVAFIRNRRTAFIKGLDILLSVAAMMPDTNFTIAGADAEIVKELSGGTIPENVALPGAVSPSDLPQLLVKHSILAHFSRTEGLANVIPEAMLCGCIPVVSPAGGNLDAVGNNIFTLQSEEITEIAAQIRRLHAQFDQKRASLRDSAAARFPESARAIFWKQMYEQH